ncbi:MAG: GNAT family N-acetyltransferase, partial [Sciscionella sp.]|nr:GNAT family N-acetyltransferase [Sciscionella sp.]
DVDMILRWRNHPRVREASFTTHEISAAEHRAWWAKINHDSCRRVLIFEYAGAPAGVVIFADIGEPVVEWSFYLDIDGLGRRLLPAWLGLEGAAVAYAFDVLGAPALGGATLAWNTPVLQLHKRFGFAQIRRYTVEIDGVSRETVWTQLRAEDRK